MNRKKQNGETKPAKRAGTAAGMLVLLALVFCLMTGCAGKGNKALTSLDQLSEPGIRIGVPDDVIEFDMLRRDYPDAVVAPYTDNPLGYQDVVSGRLDVYIYARHEMDLAIQHGTEGVRLLEETYHVNDVAIGISPVTGIPNLQEKINAFIAELRADGTLDDKDDLACTILKQTINELTYNYTEGAELTNAVCAVIRP